MPLHTDIPTRAQIDRLLTSRHPASVSVYLATEPASNGDAERIALKNLAAEAERQLLEADTAKAASITSDARPPDTAFGRRRPRVALTTNPRNGKRGMRAMFTI